ncbi:MAG TPA: helix-turn-helix transcriptional regulator [Ktedonobacteraceae bacterium]|nr:helix-turn-helix transcriptional regulator [Ktedonobacteraceae bacterium]
MDTSRKSNPLLRFEREKRGWSQRRVAEQLDTSEDMISRWERGERTPGPFFQEKLCSLFGKDAVELGFIERNFLPVNQGNTFPTSLDSNAVNLQELGILFDGSKSATDALTSSSVLTDIDVLSHLSSILSQSSMIGEKEINYLEQQTRLYWRAREESIFPASTLYNRVIRHINDITAFLIRSLLPLTRQYLCEIVCRAVLLAGVLLYDMGQYEKARQHYLVASQAASEANNFILQALVWGWMSFTWTYAKQYNDALHCIQQASHYVTQTSDSTVQAWLGAIEAEIQSHLQNREACLQSLINMERGFGTSPSQTISYLFEFNPVLLLGYKGVCLQHIYQKQQPETHHFLEEAKEALEQALQSNTPLKRKLYYLTDLAGVYAHQGEVERACYYTTQTVSLILQIGNGSKTIQQHLLQTRALLQPYQETTHVHTLDEQMAPLLPPGSSF